MVRGQDAALHLKRPSPSPTGKGHPVVWRLRSCTNLQNSGDYRQQLMKLDFLFYSAVELQSLLVTVLDGHKDSRLTRHCRFLEVSFLRSHFFKNLI